MEPESMDPKSQLLFTAIMMRYEDLSQDMAHMSAALNKRYVVHSNMTTLSPYTRTIHTKIVDFVNFARFHPKFYEQIETPYRRFLRDYKAYVGEDAEKEYARRIQRIWEIIQKAMVDQKLIELKGV